jgi:hypothetical protein
VRSQPEQSERARSEPVHATPSRLSSKSSRRCAITSSSARVLCDTRAWVTKRARNVNCRSDGSEHQAATRGRRRRTNAWPSVRSNPHDLVPLHNTPPPKKEAATAQRISARTCHAQRISARTCHARRMPDSHEADDPDRPLTFSRTGAAAGGAVGLRVSKLALDGRAHENPLWARSDRGCQGV